MNEPLFDLGELLPGYVAEPTGKRKTTKRSAPKAASWTANTTQTKCYDCVRALANGQFITAKRAQWKRTDPAGAVELFCYEHATPRRDADHAHARKQAA